MLLRYHRPPIHAPISVSTVGWPRLLPRTSKKPDSANFG
jgi:hypothetical protein